MNYRLGLLAMIGCLAAAIAGCTGPGLGGKESKEYHADYKGLENQTLAVVVYLDSAMNFEYPNAREEISNFLLQQIHQNLPTTRPIPPDIIIRWQDETINWQALNPIEIGKHFSVDRVMMVEVLEYGTRDQDVKNLLRGRLRAQVQIYEKDKTSPAWQQEIGSIWPQNGPLDVTRSSDMTVRMRVLESFASAVIGRFYDHADQLSSDTTPAKKLY